MPKRNKKGRPPAPPKFKIGDHVRVKHGTPDTDYPEMPLGGWAGTISEFHGKGMCTVRWSRETLDSIHPIFKKRCERDGMVVEEYWLGEEDLEADPGGPLSIEQPTRVVPRPLSKEDQADRVRMVFGLTSDDSLPEVDDDALATYHAYLAERLSFPFRAKHSCRDWAAGNRTRRVRVVALAEDEPPEEAWGVICKVMEGGTRRELPLAELEVRLGDRNDQLVDDYCCWFSGELTNDLDDDGDDDEELDAEDDLEEDQAISPPLEQASWRSAAWLLLEITAFATSYGAVLGTAVAVMSWAKWGACIGGVLFGIFGAVAHVASAKEDMFLIVPRLRKGFAGIVGLISGAVHGAFFGIMAVAFAGAVLGAIVGLLIRRLLGGKKGRFFRVFPGSVLAAAACGVVAQAFYMNRAFATEGLLNGALAGLVCGLFFCLVALPLSFLTVRKPDQEGAS